MAPVPRTRRRRARRLVRGHTRWRHGLPRRAGWRLAARERSGVEDGDRLRRVRRAGDLRDRAGRHDLGEDDRRGHLRLAHRPDRTRAPRGERRVSARARSIALVVGAVAVIGVAALLASGGSGRASLPDRAHEIAAGLRCPVCLNLSVADSPSGLAREMRSEITLRLRAGEGPEQIRAFFVDRYGEWILLEPPKRGLNLVPWAVPIVALIAGVAIWVAVVRRRGADGDTPASAVGDRPTETERARIDRELADLQEPG